MRMHLLSAAALLAVASSASARDGQPYVGIEGGIMSLKNANLEYQGLSGSEDGSIKVDHKLGLDADLIAGYDFGMFRGEVELGFKRAAIDKSDASIPNFGPFDPEGGKARAASLMANLLLDFGSDEGTSFFVGGGVGVARTKYTIDEISFGATDNNIAYQFIAGARTAISPSIDAGLKYRYFRSKYNLQEGDTEEVIGRWKSHSLLASLIFNFGAPAPAPVVAPVEIAPPPPPPAVQTCFDGSVILATEGCPAPPVEMAPPPPPPAPERG